MKRFSGWKLKSLNVTTRYNEKKRTIFLYFAMRHIELRHFPNQVEISYHNKFGTFQWALYLKTKYPFLSAIPDLDLDEVYKRQYWEDVEDGIWDEW